MLFGERATNNMNEGVTNDDGMGECKMHSQIESDRIILDDFSTRNRTRGICSPPQLMCVDAAGSVWWF